MEKLPMEAGLDILKPSNVFVLRMLMVHQTIVADIELRMVVAVHSLLTNVTIRHLSLAM
jgi:hypothetical protein